MNGKVHRHTHNGYVKENNSMVVCEVQSEITKRIYALSLEGVGTNKNSWKY
jgi:hypothetical protein